ncbi:methylated-DNA--protein-cysteine methyltransferase [Hypocenomyce scalaris]|nr:methylated-DNA--protein-cysteine methyltransferase [Hypocenomyce scalaris]
MAAGDSNSKSSEKGRVTGRKENAGVQKRREGLRRMLPAAKKSRKDEMADTWARFHGNGQGDESILPRSFQGRDDLAFPYPKETTSPSTQPSATLSSIPSKQERSHALFSSTNKQAIQISALALEEARYKISTHPKLTTYRKRVLTLLTQVPRGQYTTYKALANALANLALSHDEKRKTNAKSVGCARAIGSAMRNNPFAPVVPCHRVVAADGQIGGFKGDWGEEGRFVREKKRLLREEGVRFNEHERVVGSPFVNFV